MGSGNCPTFLDPSVLEVITECCFQGVALSVWFPYTLPTCLDVVSLSDSPQMTEVVLFDFIEKSHWLDKAGANVSNYLT